MTNNSDQTEIFNSGTSLPLVAIDAIRNGQTVAGDDYSMDQIQLWFEQEKEAYFCADGGMSVADLWYSYMHYVNWRLGFDRVPHINRPSGELLVLGPGRGAEIEEYQRTHPRWTVNFVEASDNFRALLSTAFPLSRVIPANVTGEIGLASNSQDVACAFSVLHHIPNVTYVLSEIYRTLAPGGVALIREPCSSMGDWRFPRQATPNERGISKIAFIRIATTIGFEVLYPPVRILFSPINSALRYTKMHSKVSDKVIFLLDRMFSWVASHCDFYWRDRWYKKFGPSAYFYVIRKPLSRL